MRYKKHITILVVIVLIILGIRYTDLGNLLTLENLKQNGDEIRQFVESNYFVSILVFIVGYIFIAGLSIPGATIMTLAGGFLFGALFATIYVNIGATIGAFMVFLLSHYIIGNWAQQKYADKLKKFNKEIEENGANYLLTLRFIPLFPFFLVNIFAGLTKINYKTFLWTTSLGIIPGSFVYAYAGRQLGTIESLGDILSFNVILAFLFLGILSLVPAVYNHFKTKGTFAKKSLAKPVAVSNKKLKINKDRLRK